MRFQRESGDVGWLPGGVPGGELPTSVCWIATFPTSQHPADTTLQRG